MIIRVHNFDIEFPSGYFFLSCLLWFIFLILSVPEMFEVAPNQSYNNETNCALMREKAITSFVLLFDRFFKV